MLRFQFKAYRRRFEDTWVTSSSSWKHREGLIIRLEDKDGRYGFGEAAPIESFGSETFLSALSICQGFGERVEWESVRDEMGAYPCLRFAFESALEMIASAEKWPVIEGPLKVCGLSRGLGEEDDLERLMEWNYQSLKFKIGVADFDWERRHLERVVDRTEGKIGIRLDANGGLSLKQSMEWLEFLADLPALEYLEQPMAPGGEETMIGLSADYPTPLALDESVCRVDDLKRWQDLQWPGFFVVKPLLSGSYWELQDELVQCDSDRVVLSSSLETKVGAWAALKLANEAETLETSLGFGTDRLFNDENVGLSVGAFLQSADFPSMESLQSFWNRI